MQNGLKANEIKAVERFMETHPHANLLRQYVSWKNFEAGDVLIRYRSDHEGNARVDHVSEQCKVPKKFKVMFVDEELGLPWVKNVNVRGGLGSKLYCLTESVGYSYVVDPECLECELLGVKYDPRAQYREWRKGNPNYGG